MKVHGWSNKDPSCEHGGVVEVGADGVHPEVSGEDKVKARRVQ